MNIWHAVSGSRVKPDEFIACIEIPAGSKNKYELDKATGALILDRILYTSTPLSSELWLHSPYLKRGWRPASTSLSSRASPSSPLALTQAFPIGILEMDDTGSLDEKIIAICAHDPLYSAYKDISELPPACER
jgi:inorganic pyrophosphatase